MAENATAPLGKIYCVPFDIAERLQQIMDLGAHTIFADDKSVVLDERMKLQRHLVAPVDELSELSECEELHTTRSSSKRRSRKSVGKRVIRHLPAFPPSQRSRIERLPSKPPISPASELSVPFSPQDPPAYTLPSDPICRTKRLPVEPDTPSSPQQKKARWTKNTKQTLRRRKNSRAHRHSRREMFKEASGGVKQVSLKRMGESQPFRVADFDAASLPIAQGAWVGKRQFFKPVGRTLADVVAANVEIIPWEGNTTHPILDRNSRMFMLMLGRTRGSDWGKLCTRMENKLKQAQADAKFTAKELYHQRGKFPVARTGVSHGGGTEEPGNIANSPENAAAFKELCEDSDFIRDAGYINSILKLYNPALHKLYWDVRAALSSQYSDLHWNFPNSPFAATTVNFEHAVLDDHVDSANLAYGWCRVRPFGTYDPKRGGHLILWDLGVAIEFPPGTDIFLPSALLVHSNVAIQQGETRYSMTSYSAGGLFRWVYNGGMTNEDFLASLTVEQRKREAEDRSTRVHEFLDFFPVWK